MAKPDKKKVSRIKTKKKIWYKVLAPKLFGNKHIGDTYLTNPESALGRVLTVNLKDVTGNMRDQNAYMKFTISKLDGTTLHTDPIGYQLTTAFVKRLVRKNLDRVDVHCKINTKDGKGLVVKALLLTVNKTYNSTRTQLRETYANLLQQQASELDFGTFVSYLTTNKIQSGLKRKLAKICPLREAAVRVMTLVSVPSQSGVKKETALVPEDSPKSPDLDKSDKPDESESKPEPKPEESPQK